MASRAIQWVLVIVAIGIGSVDATRVRAEGDDPAALAAALKDTTATLQGGLKASEREGTPISAKFEIGDGKLQLAVYTMKGDTYNEMVADPRPARSRRPRRSKMPTTSRRRQHRKLRWQRRRCPC